VVNALDHRRTARVTAGEIAGTADDLAGDTRLARGLRQPFQLWQVESSRAMLALAKGSLAEAEELVPRARALGEKAQPAVAIPVYRLQRYTLCEFRGRLADVLPEIRDSVAEYPTRPVFRCALAHCHARLGRLAESARAFGEIEPAEFVLPFDQEWLLGMSMLAETSALLRRRDSATVLYRLLTPWAELNVGDHPEAIRGSVARYLGILASAVERWDDAELHFEAAIAANERMGLRPWLALTRHDYARMLVARAGSGDRERADRLLGQALAGYRELGMMPPVGEPALRRSARGARRSPAARPG
jgi:tetratricopeptide (TPR) repeat protein